MRTQLHRFARALTMILTMAVFARAALAAGQAALPDAKTIIARHVAAIGGEAAFKALKFIHAKGRFEIPAQKLTGDLELWSARPAKQLNRSSLAAIGTIESGYNGTIAWTISPMSGPELVAGRQLTEAADDAWFDATLYQPDHVREMTTVARAEFDGRPAFQVKVILKSGSEQVDYFDVETGLQMGTEATRAIPQGVVPTVTILRNYRKFGAVLQPTTLVQRTLGIEQVATLTSIDYDPIPDRVFDPPAEVKALVRP